MMMMMMSRCAHTLAIHNRLSIRLCMLRAYTYSASHSPLAVVMSVLAQPFLSLRRLGHKPRRTHPYSNWVQSDPPHNIHLVLGVATTCSRHTPRSASLQAAHSSQGLFTCAVAVTRPTKSESAVSGRPALGVTWLQGRVTADMILQVSLPPLLPSDKCMLGLWHASAAAPVSASQYRTHLQLAEGAVWTSTVNTVSGEVEPDENK